MRDPETEDRIDPHWPTVYAHATRAKTELSLVDDALGRGCEQDAKRAEVRSSMDDLNSIIKESIDHIPEGDLPFVASECARDVREEIRREEMQYDYERMMAEKTEREPAAERPVREVGT